MSVLNEQNQDPLTSDVHVDSDKAHLSEVHEHADFENIREKNYSEKDETELSTELTASRGSLENTDNERQYICYQCDEIGHKSYECPLVSKIENFTRKCYKCKEVGHKISECPLRDTNNDAVNKHDRQNKKQCTNCLKIGHRRRNCPFINKNKPIKTLKKNVYKKKCFVCSGIGHNGYECPTKKKLDNMKRKIKCYECGVFGHKISECPLRDTDKDANNDDDDNSFECPIEEMEDYSDYSSYDELSKDIDEGSVNNDESEIKCFLCNGIGHTSDECMSGIKKSTKKRPASKELFDEGLDTLKKMRPSEGVDDNDEDRLIKTICFICDTAGHKSGTCPNRKVEVADEKQCFNCGKLGHKAFKCPLKETLSDRSRSRSPLQKLHAQGDNSGNRNFLNPDCRYLFVANLPPHWYVTKIRQFFSESCKSNALVQALKYITVLKDNNGRSKGECIMEFTSANACLLAMKAMRGADVEGKKIIAMPDTGLTLGMIKNENSNDTRNNSTPGSQPPPTNPDQMSDNNMTYGLSLAFLESLNIKLPLKSKIFVGNLDNQVTEAGLRELFNHAGQVVSVFLKKSPDVKAIAKVEFDHPVEAVQAISMFHNRVYFGEFMIVKMDAKPHVKPTLPAGLISIGPGLGPNGEPLRGIRYVVELEPIKQMLLQELSKIKSFKMHEFQDEKRNMSNESHPQMDPSADMMNNMNYQNAMTGMNNLFGWMGLQGLLQPNLGFAPSITDLQGQMNPNMGQNFMPMGQMNGPQNQMNNWTQNQVDVPQNQMNWTQNQIDVPHNQMNIPQSQGNMPQNHFNAAQNQMNIPSNQTMVQNHYTNVPQNQDVRQSQNNTASSHLANMTPSQLINMSQNQLADLPKSQVSQSWSTGQQSEWSTQQHSQSPAASHSKDKNYYEDSGSTFGESSKYNKATASRHSDSGSRRSEEKNAMTSTDMLVFKNLPPSVTVKALKSKMREVGELRYVEITGEGRAIVRFNEARDAALCYKLFDRSKVDGQTISVNYF